MNIKARQFTTASFLSLGGFMPVTCIFIRQVRREISVVLSPRAPGEVLATSLPLRDYDVLMIGGSTAAERMIPRLLDSGADVTVCEGGGIITAIEAWVADNRITLTRTGFTEAMNWGKALMVCCDEALLREVTLKGYRRGTLVDNETRSSSPLTSVMLTGRRASRAGDLAGQVALVGGGPGDPDLITIKGHRILRLTDIVVADHLSPPSLLDNLESDVEITDADKLPCDHAMARERINELLIHRAREDCLVVRLKGGDPYVFGRSFEELQGLQRAGVPVRVMPGIASALAVPGMIGIPVTVCDVNHKFAAVSDHVPPEHKTSLVNWDALGRMYGTVAIIMGVKNRPKIAEALMKAGRNPRTPAVVIRNSTLPNQRSLRCTLSELDERVVEEIIRPPAVIVIDEVAGLGEGDE